jgi:hypothetical protein
MQVAIRMAMRRPIGPSVLILLIQGGNIPTESVQCTVVGNTLPGINLNAVQY